MSVVLQDAAVAMFRQAFTSQEVFDVLPYAGDFTLADIKDVAFKSPAVLVGVLGWAPPRASDRMRDVRARSVFMVAFMACKTGDRMARGRAAQSIAEKAHELLLAWRPADTVSTYLAAPQDDIRAQNMWAKEADQLGMALWMVSWRQCVQGKSGVGGLVDVLGIDIESTVRAVHAADEVAPAPPPLAVTHEIDFQQDTPPTD